LRYRDQARAPPRALPASPAGGLSVAITPADPRRKQAKDEDENEGVHFDDPRGRGTPGSVRKAPIACRLQNRSTRGSATHNHSPPRITLSSLENGRIGAPARAVAADKANAGLLEKSVF